MTDVRQQLTEALDSAERGAREILADVSRMPASGAAWRRFAEERLRLVERDRAMVRAYEQFDEMVAEHVRRCGPDACDHHDYTGAVARAEALRMVLDAAAAFWLGTPEVDHG